MELFYIILFGVLGVLCRYYQGIFITKYFSPPFPFATFIINILGCFFIGVVSALLIPFPLRMGLMVGFLGGYTTFSSYCLEAVRLVEAREYFYASLYFLLSPILGFFMVLLGIFLVRGL